MGLDERAKDHGVGGDSIMGGMALYASCPYGSIWILKKFFLAQFTEYDTDIVHVVGEFLHDNKGEHRIKVGGDPIMGGMALYATAHVAQFWILKKTLPGPDYTV